MPALFLSKYMSKTAMLMMEDMYDSAPTANSQRGFQFQEALIGTVMGSAISGTMTSPAKNTGQSQVSLTIVAPTMQ
jgi:hypothetical protein